MLLTAVLFAKPFIYPETTGRLDNGGTNFSMLLYQCTSPSIWWDNLKRSDTIILGQENLPLYSNTFLKCTSPAKTISANAPKRLMPARMFGKQMWTLVLQSNKDICAQTVAFPVHCSLLEICYSQFIYPHSLVLKIALMQSGSRTNDMWLRWPITHHK